MSDTALAAIRRMMEQKFGVHFTKDISRDAARVLAEENAFHPVKEYFEKVQEQWDGKGRIDRWLIDYLGAEDGVEDTPFVRAAGALMLIAMVRRIRQPGAKYDEMVVLEGPQGNEKSTALKILAGEEWFTDEADLGKDVKRLIEDTEGKMLIEVGELASFRRSDVNQLKKVLSKTTDRARMAYGFFSEERKRQFVLVGTTNEERYLVDRTGNRRFWPVKTSKIKIEDLKRDRDQLWAEAAVRESAGESIRLPQGLWALAGKKQKERVQEEPWEIVIGEFLSGREGKITTETLFGILKIEAGKRSSWDASRLCGVMKELGWERVKHIPLEGGKQARGYKKGSDQSVIEGMPQIC